MLVLLALPHVIGAQLALPAKGSRVVSVSLFGKEPKFIRYLASIEHSVHELFGDDWEFRVYTNVPWRTLRTAGLTGNRTRIMRAPADVPNPRAWRFMPGIDPTVSVFLSRDTDNELIARDRDAVFDWLNNSTRDCHVMRDHPKHGTEIMGGMWGFRNAGPYRKHFEHLIYDPHNKRKQDDQRALSRHLWPHVKCLAHDAYLCGRYKDAEWRPFPTQRDAEGHFIGGAWTINISCPVHCRKHPDWTYC
mmetsp:Transcript_50501/g.163632  ORF Transcript_50501/g.163632 Transcript_50501/m.163632 type:complete len:247 (-) Transcript_50501:239-979(-)